MLISGGIIAAGILVYFSHGYINSQKTQGAIGQRDVYRDGEVKAADVAATPGAAPIAMKAILESKEFQSLTKNPAFASMISSKAFTELAADPLFVSLMQESSLQQIFARSSQEALAASNVQAMRLDLMHFLNQNTQYASLANNAAFNAVAGNLSFYTAMSSNQSLFAGLVSSLQTSLANASAANLARQ